MKKLVILLVGLIMITNAFWGYKYLNHDDKSSKTAVQIYTLKGSGTLWDIHDYKIIVSPNKILRGNGNLTYKGDSSRIENSTYYKIEMKEKNSDGIYETVYSNQASSHNGPVSILTNLSDIGSITGEYNQDERKKNEQNYASTTLTMTWTDNDGELFTEEINLSIVSDLTLD